MKTEKKLTVKFPGKCIGCELCAMQIQRQLGKVGLDGSLIRILRDGIKYSVVVDQNVNKYDINELKQICPTGVFAVEEIQDEL